MSCCFPSSILLKESVHVPGLQCRFPSSVDFSSFLQRIEFRRSVDSYLELVLAGLSLRRGVKEIDRENLKTAMLVDMKFR
jgi:hypothetical protein